MQQLKQTNIDELTLRDLFLILRVRTLLIFGVTIIFGIAGGIGAWFAPKHYQASVMLLPVANTPGGLGSTSGSSLGGLAALAGISVGSDSKKSESIAVLQSEALTERYIEKNNLLPIIYSNEWDGNRNSWKNPSDAPTPWKANKYFKNSVRTVNTDIKTGIVTLTIEWKNASFAAEWANGLVAMTNEYLRNNAILESERNIAYLTAEAAKTNIVEARQAIYALLQGEINKGMLARGGFEFAFKILDPAHIPEKHSSPLLSLWIVIGLVAGFLLSTVAVLCYTSWK